MNTCQCGCGMPAGEGKRYLNDAHKQKAYRTRKRQSARSMARFAGDLIWKTFDEDKAAQIAELLSAVKTPKAIDSVGAAVYLMLTELISRGAKNAN